MGRVVHEQETRTRKSSLRAACEVLGLILFVGTSWLGCKHGSKDPNAAAHKGPSAVEIKAVLHLEPFVVNLADPEESRFLRIGIDLGLENPLPAKEGHGGTPVIPTAALRDTVLGVLSTWHSDDLLAPDGKQKLKQELVHALRARAPELGVKEVYFTEFLVQR